jgi:hypothetical protein
MNKWHAVGLVGLAFLVPTARKVGDLGAAELMQSVWLTDYVQARATARASGKPIFVVFRCEH